MTTFSDLTTPQQLDSLDHDGLIAFLASDHPDRVALWNEWRRLHDWEQVGLEEAQLIGVSLEGITFSLTDLTRADLTGAQLDNAQFNGAILAGADLASASLAGASLRQADLTACSLRGAILRGVDLSEVKSLRGAALFQTQWEGVTGLNAGMILSAPIAEMTAARFTEAVDAYRALRQFFESQGDSRTADDLFAAEQKARRLSHVPGGLRLLHPRYRKRFIDAYARPNLLQWLRLTASGSTTRYGTSLLRPLLWIALIIVVFALIYVTGGFVTDVPACGVVEFNIEPIDGCQPSRQFVDGMLFSLGSALVIDVSLVRPYLSHVWILQVIEALLVVPLLGVWGYVAARRVQNRQKFSAQ